MTKENPSTIETLFNQLKKELNANGDKVTKGFQGVVKFKIGGEEWTLESLENIKRLTRGESDLEADVELEASEENFIKLIMGQISPQTAFMVGKLKLSGNMGLALKLQPILAAAKPKPKL